MKLSYQKIYILLLNPIIGAYSVFQNPIEIAGLVVALFIKITMVFKTKETVLSYNDYRIVYYTHVFIGFRGKFHSSIMTLTQTEVNGVNLLNWNFGFWYLDRAKRREGEAKTKS